MFDLKWFKENLENILIEKYKKELKENKIMTEIINKKVEDSLKIVTQKLKDKLLIELDKYFPISQIIIMEITFNMMKILILWILKYFKYILIYN